MKLVAGYILDSGRIVRMEDWYTWHSDVMDWRKRAAENVVTFREMESRWIFRIDNLEKFNRRQLRAIRGLISGRGRKPVEIYVFRNEQDKRGKGFEFRNLQIFYLFLEWLLKNRNLDKLGSFSEFEL